MKAIQAVSPILFHHADEPISKSIRTLLKETDDWTSGIFLGLLKEIADFESVAILRLPPFPPDDFSRSDYLEMVRILGSVDGKILGPIRAAFLVRVFHEWLSAEVKKTPFVYISHDVLDNNVQQALQANGVEVINAKDIKEEPKNLTVKEESIATSTNGINGIKEDDMANEDVKVSTIVVRNKDVGAIVGKRGDRLCSLERYSGAYISIDKSSGSADRKVFVKGTPEQVEKATSVIRGLTEECPLLESPIKVIDDDLFDRLSAAGIKIHVTQGTNTFSEILLLVPGDMKATSRKDDIERQSGANICVRESRDSNIHRVFVRGTLEEVRQACTMIYKVISQKPPVHQKPPKGLVIKSPKSAINLSDLEAILKKFPTFPKDLQDLIYSQQDINGYVNEIPFFMAILLKLIKLVAPTELLVMISQLFVKKGVDLSLKDGQGLTAFDRVEEFLMTTNDNSLLADQLLIILLPK